jgi:uncharacterized protein (UPF0548 family)
VISTLNGHLISGEERFKVLFDYHTGDVTLQLSSFTKGSGILGSITMPFIRPLQNQFFRDIFRTFPSLLQGSG